MENTTNFWLDATELKVKEIATATPPYKPRDTDQFMIDVQKTLTDWIYGNKNEAIKWVLEYANSKWVTYKGIDTNNMLSQVSDRITEESKTSFLSKTYEAAKWGIGRIKEAWEWLANDKYDIDEAFARWAAWALQTFFSPVAWLVWEWIEAIPQDVKTSLLETATPTIQWITAWYQGQSPEQQRELANIGVWAEVVAEFLWMKGIQLGWKKLISEAWEALVKWTDLKTAVTKKAWDVVDTFKPTKTGVDDKLLKNLNLETVKGKIWDVEVDILKIDKTVAEKVVDMFPWKTEKELAGRAVSPRTVWKNAKQKLKSVADVEKNTKQLYDNVRTWVLEWSIDTLEETAQTVVNNIDTIWARIGNAVKKVDWTIDIDNDITWEMIKALWAWGAKVSPATPILRNFYEELGTWHLSVAKAYSIKKAYANEVTKLYKAWDAWTEQYKALSNWVKFLNTKIDEIIDTKLWDEFAKDKALFSQLKTVVDDLVASSLVEWRRSPNTLAEQIWMVESIFSPISSAKMKLIQTVWEQNTRGWAWKQLIKQYDAASIKNYWLVPDAVKVPELAAIKALPVKTAKEIDTVTNRILDWITVSKANAAAAWVIIRDFLKKYWAEFKDKLWELFDDLADKVWARSKFMDESKNLKDFNKVWTTESALVKEAKKYKSAEEFIKKKVNLLHWTNNKFDKFNINAKPVHWKSMWGQGIYVTDSPILAGNYWKNTMQLFAPKQKPFAFHKYNNIDDISKELNLPKEYFKTIDIWGKDSVGLVLWGSNERLIQKEFTDRIKELWYDSVLVKHTDKVNEYVILNPESIKTESQLKDIYNQSKK